jgi:hypothetical protein
MAQIIKHRRGSITNVGTLSPVNAGEIVLGTGSIGNLVGPVLFVGDSSSYKAVPQLYYGSSAPDISTYSQLEGVSFYNSTDKNLYILKAAGNTRLDLSGAVSGSAITPLSVTTGIITGSNLYLSGNATIDGNINLGGNITLGNSNTDFVSFGADVTSNILPDSANLLDLGELGKEWRRIYAGQGIFTSASGSFSGSFVGDGAGLTGLATSLLVYGDFGSGSVNLLNQNLKVLGTANEIETFAVLNSGSDGYTVQIGLPNDVTIGGDLTVSGNIVLDSISFDDINSNGSASFANNLTVLGTSNLNTIISTTGLLSVNSNVFINGWALSSNANVRTGVTTFAVVNSGSGAYLFDQYSGNNPDIYLHPGQTVSFNINASGHPFLIRQTNGGTLYNVGLTHVSTTGVVTVESGAQAKETGTLIWKVPSVLAGNTYVYQCQNHSVMVGNLIIQPTVTSVNATATAALAAAVASTGDSLAFAIALG